MLLWSQQVSLSDFDTSWTLQESTSRSKHHYSVHLCRACCDEYLHVHVYYLCMYVCFSILYIREETPLPCNCTNISHVYVDMYMYMNGHFISLQLQCYCINESKTSQSNAANFEVRNSTTYLRDGTMRWGGGWILVLRRHDRIHVLLHCSVYVHVLCMY